MSTLDPRRSLEFWRGRASLSGVAATSLKDAVPSWVNRWSVARTRRKVIGWLRRKTPYGRALDLGCGNGDATLDYAQLAEHVTAVDFVPEFVEQAREAARRRQIANVDFHVGSIEDFAATGPFDLILLAAVVMYLDETAMRRTFTLLRDVLAPGGMIYVRASTHFTGLTDADGAKQAIYRPAAAYAAFFRDLGFRLRAIRLSREYSYDDLVAIYFRHLNRWTGGRFRQSERAMRFVFALIRTLRPLSLDLPLSFLNVFRVRYPSLRSHHFLLELSK